MGRCDKKKSRIDDHVINYEWCIFRVYIIVMVIDENFILFYRQSQISMEIHSSGIPIEKSNFGLDAEWIT